MKCTHSPREKRRKNPQLSEARRLVTFTPHASFIAAVIRVVSHTEKRL